MSTTEKDIICPKCKEYLYSGKLVGWNDSTKKNDIYVNIEGQTDLESYPLNIWFCKTCGYVKLRLG